MSVSSKTNMDLKANKTHNDLHGKPLKVSLLMNSKPRNKLTKDHNTFQFIVCCLNQKTIIRSIRSAKFRFLFFFRNLLRVSNDLTL